MEFIKISKNPKIVCMDERAFSIIEKTLKIIPPDIQDKVLDEVHFIAFYDELGRACNGVFSIKKNLIQPNKPDEDIATLPLVILNLGNVERCVYLKSEQKEKRMMSITAHEIAHFADPIARKNNFKDVDGEMEKRADDLCEKWGFERRYTETDYMAAKEKSLKRPHA